MQFPPIEIIFNLHPPIREVCAIKLFYSRRPSCFLSHCSHSNLTLGSDTSCREFQLKFQPMRNKTNREKHTSKKTITRTRQYLCGSAICLHPRSCRDFTIKYGDTIVYKNTLKKPNSQYTLILFYPQDKKTLFFLLMRLLGY